MKETEEANQPNWDLIAKYLRGETTEEEKRALFTWVNQQPENKELFNQVSNVWNATAWESSKRSASESDQAPDFHPDVESAWRRFSERATIRQSNADLAVAWPVEEPLANEESKPLGRPFSQLMRIAAVLLMVFGAAFWVKFYLADRALPRISQKTNAEERLVFLPDSSKVYLNKNSELSYSEGFGDGTRVVHLSGEAFFEVKKVRDTTFGKAFTIFSGNAKTEVLGTSFNVRSYPAEKSVEVVVMTGKVAFSVHTPKQATSNELDTSRVLLTPGLRAEWKPTKGIATSRVSDTNAIAWKSHRLAFDNTQLQVVIATLERYFGVPIKVSNPRLLQCRFTGSFENPDLEEILEVLKVSINVDYSTNHHQYLLSGQGCQ